MGTGPDIFEKIADGVRRVGVRSIHFVISYFGLGLLILSWIGAAFLKDLVWPPLSGEPAKPPWMIPLAVIIVLAGVFSLILQARDTTKNGSLREKVADLTGALKSFGEDCRDMWTFVLYRWASELSLDGSHRISVYKHEDDHFIMIARFSHAKPLASRGRSIYPDNQGCIGSAWLAADGKCYTDDLPRPQSQAARYRNKHQRAWGLPLDVVNNLTMKPRAIYATAIIDDGGQRHAIAVFESIEPDGLDVAAIDAFMDNYGNEEANRWMAATKNQLPSLRLAQAEGL